MLNYEPLKNPKKKKKKRVRKAAHNTREPERNVSGIFFFSAIFLFRSLIFATHTQLLAIILSKKKSSLFLGLFV